MTNWKYTCNIKPFINDDKSCEGITLAANSVAKKLRTLPEHLFENSAFEDAVCFLEGVDVSDEEVYDSGQELLEEVNHCLNIIYDFADNEKIWLGL